MNIFRRKSHKMAYEAAFSILLILNACLLLYFIFKLNQIENLAQETQSSAMELINKLETR